MAAIPSPSDINQVMKLCSCNRKEAIELLKYSGNDPQQAQRRHEMRVQFGWTPTVRTPRRSPKPDATQPVPGLSKHRQTPDNTPENDDYDIITPQSDKEVFSQGLKPPYSGIQPPHGTSLPTNSLPVDGTENKKHSTRSNLTFKNPADDDDSSSSTLKSPFGYSTPSANTPQRFIPNPARMPFAEEGPIPIQGRQEGGPGERKPVSEREGETEVDRAISDSKLLPHRHRPSSVDAPRNSVPDPAPLTIFDASQSNQPIEAGQLQREYGDKQEQLAKVSDLSQAPYFQETLNQSLSSSKPEWDFTLPKVSSVVSPHRGRGSPRFNVYEAVARIQNQPDERAIQSYFEDYEPRVLQSYINQEVEGFPSIFYAVATNNDRILRAWIANGADVNAVHEQSGVPLLAFAIVHSETIEEDTTDIVATLLSTGASPLAIAESFYKPYNQDLPDEGPSDEEMKLCGSKQTVWLHQTAKEKLTRNLNLTHRYNLERAARTSKPSVRQKQVAERNKAEGLLGLPYFLIGQSLAADKLLQACINHLAHRTERRKPLVIVFAGPSGHGKTELARRLGYLMSLELEVVDCTIVNREMELFGGRHPYVNAAEGTPLNNFLARNSGKRCIVFMDEFEKTTKEIHQALLLPFDNGEYQDRRTLKPIDCSKTIWILATNALDRRIRDFCKVNETILFDEELSEDRTRLMKELDKNLKNDFLAKFDAPITGRISAFLPFLLFSSSEQAVIAHKYLLELGREVRRPVNLTVGPEERLIGNVRLHISRDASVCAHIAEDCYHPDLGARSLITGVENVRNMLIDAYLDVDEAIREAEELVEFTVDMKKGNIFVEMVS